MRKKLKSDFQYNRYLYFMIIPVVVYYIMFHYVPMYGAIIAFKDFVPRQGIMGSPWVGLKHFREFFTNKAALNAVLNTLSISIKDILFGFPMPIILALMINEIKHNKFKKVVQTATYLPHFISLVVICGLILNFCASDGVVNDILSYFGFARTNYMMQPSKFQGIFVGTNIWQGAGWGSIIYLSAISSVDTEIYESSVLDGATRFKQMLYITLPCILPTIAIMFILRLGQVMSVGFEKVILLYNPLTMQKADVISSFVYRRGLLDFDFSFSAAVGLFNSLINFILVMAANMFSKKIADTSLF